MVVAKLSRLEMEGDYSVEGEKLQKNMLQEAEVYLPERGAHY